MYLAPYRLEDLHFAYCYHSYLRWNTRCLRPYRALARLDLSTLQRLTAELGIHILEVAPTATDVRVLVSLKPTETISACASKLKGRTSRWLRAELGLEEATPLLSRGYFACTTGKSTRQQVEAYLEQQSEHHGYVHRPLPPVYVGEYSVPAELDNRLRPQHAWCVLHTHIVLATQQRRGLFAEAESEAVAGSWLACQQKVGFALRKVSFLPDHVHIAVQLRPTTAPAKLVVLLMNQAQEVIGERFGAEAVRARLGRLWQPSAYVGSYGELASPQVQQYIRKWQKDGRE